MISVTVHSQGMDDLVTGVMEEIAKTMRRDLSGFRCPTHGDATEIAVAVKSEGWEVECCCEMSQAEVDRYITEM